MAHRAGKFYVVSEGGTTIGDLKDNTHSVGEWLQKVVDSYGRALAHAYDIWLNSVRVFMLIHPLQFHLGADSLFSGLEI